MHVVQHLPLGLAPTTTTALLGSLGSVTATATLADIRYTMSSGLVTVDMAAAMRYTISYTLAKQVVLGNLVAVHTITEVVVGMVAGSSEVTPGGGFAATPIVHRREMVVIGLPKNLKNIIFVNFKINHPSQKLINSLNYKKASLKEM